MGKETILLVLLSLVLFFSAGSFAIDSASMMRMPYSFCTDSNSSYWTNFVYSDENVRSCLMHAWPYRVSDCQSIPSNLAEEFRESCYLKIHSCGDISSPAMKQQCENEVAQKNYSSSVGIFWGGACLIIPIIILALLVYGIFEAVRKKITKRKATAITIAIILLVFIWMFLVGAAPCNTCFTVCLY